MEYCQLRRRVPAGQGSGAATGAAASIGCHAGGCQLGHPGPQRLSRSALAGGAVEQPFGAAEKENSRRTEVVGTFPGRPATRHLMGESWRGSMTWNNTAGSALHPDHRAVRTLVLGNNLDPGLVPVGAHLRQSHGNGGGQRPGGASLCPLGIRRPQLPHRCSSAAPTGPAGIVDAEHIVMSTALAFLGCSSTEQSAGTRLAPLTSRPLLAHISIDVTMLLHQC